MKYFRTPFEIVKIMKKHLPIAQMRILEPAVGEGALLETLNPLRVGRNVTAIDIDPARLKALKYTYKKINLINEDFLEWSERCTYKYDLIITNPPFSAKSKDWISYENKKIPIELLFFIKSIKLLDSGGTLIGIVPDAIINSSSFSEERMDIMLNNKITYVYQLPKRVFKSIESGFFLIVVKKGGVTNKVTLRRVCDNGCEEIFVDRHEVAKNNFRLDFSFYSSARFYNGGLSIHEKLPLQKLSDFCEIKRGGVRNCYQTHGLIHTWSFKNGVWGEDFTFLNDRENYCVMVKRVSRNAHLTFGVAKNKDIVNTTDCVIIISSSEVDPFKLLFFLRVFYSNSHGEDYMLKGTGAKFISVSFLNDIKYLDISTIYRNDFENYCNALLERDFLTCKEIESHVFIRFFSQDKVFSIFDESYMKNSDVCHEVENLKNTSLII
ncbi:class I SAM-dependent methyltransferase [Halomonas sp. IOP_14]|uniref:Eco57I restriction-modification methylase domain-containing protein n=1 Tax=Halomonas sp. IOP_14 TaxID=2873295 RepID=UPI001E4C5E9A|nr:class I SAM-dependent methyltransferase [Halomonas sp. IOP_14]MCD1589017.1 class I SAM-dependent methyltransferase [Halomonas sp. IOP_14]